MYEARQNKEKVSRRIDGKIRQGNCVINTKSKNEFTIQLIKNTLLIKMQELDGLQKMEYKKS